MRLSGQACASVCFEYLDICKVRCISCDRAEIDWVSTATIVQSSCISRFALKGMFERAFSNFDETCLGLFVQITRRQQYSFCAMPIQWNRTYNGALTTVRILMFV